MGDTLKTGVSHGETSKTAVDKSIASTQLTTGHTVDAGHTAYWGQPLDDIQKSFKTAFDKSIARHTVDDGAHTAEG